MNKFSNLTFYFHDISFFVFIAALHVSHVIVKLNCSFALIFESRYLRIELGASDDLQWWCCFQQIRYIVRIANADRFSLCLDQRQCDDLCYCQSVRDSKLKKRATLLVLRTITKTWWFKSIIWQIGMLSMSLWL